MAKKDDVPTLPQLKSQIGERLARAREAKGVTQVAMGEACGKTGPTQSKYESGESTPDWRYLRLLEKIYGISLHYLWTGEPDSKPKRPRKTT